MTECFNASRRTLLAGLAGTALAAAFPASLVQAQTRKGVLRISTIGLDVSDFHRHTGSIGVPQVIAETLTGVAKDGSAVPFLAERWEISADGRTYRFILRAGVKFHNGRILTARDIAANIERVRDKVKGGWLTSTFKTVEALDTPDERTLVVRFAAPFAPLLNLLSEMWIIAPESPGWNETVTQPICTGPFVFETWQPQVKLVAPAFKDYWMPGKPMVEAVQFDLGDIADASMALRAGDFHIANIPQNKVEAVERDPKTQVVYRHDTGWAFWSFNNRKPRAPFDNPRVRQAIAFAMDKPSLARVFGGSAGIVTNQMVAPGNFYFDEAMHKADAHARPDLARAKKMLADEKVDPSKITLHVLSEQSERFAAPSVQMLRQLGFQIDHRTYDDIGFQKALAVYDWDLFPGSSGPRADVYLRYVRLMSDGPNPGLWGGIQDPELDAQIRAATAAVDGELRKAAYDKAMQRVLDLYYFLPIAHARGAYGVRRDVKGFEPGFTYALHGPDFGIANVAIPA